MKSILILMSLCACSAFAQPGVGLIGIGDTSAVRATLPVNASLSTVAPNPLLTANQIAQLQSENEKIRFDLIAAVNRLSNLDGSINRASEKADAASIRSSWLAFLTVVFSFGFGLVGQYFLIRHQRRLNREQERAKVSNSYIEWQLKHS